jgi:hypothetical protein
LYEKGHVTAVLYAITQALFSNEQQQLPVRRFSGPAPMREVRQPSQRRPVLVML